MRFYWLAPSAKIDFLEIRNYSRSRWGKPRTAKYLCDLEKGFQTLADNPEMGRQREDIAPGVRSFPVARHVILFRDTPDGLEIARILHAHMDVANQFSAHRHTQ